MHSFKTTFLLFLCAAVTSAQNSTTAKPDEAFYISNLKIERVTGANTTLHFTVHDSDPPLTNATKVCKGSWDTAAENYPDGPYVICGKSTFAWTMASFTSICDFSLDVEHSFKDPAVGAPPYNVITNFAEANITKPTITCSRSGGSRVCEQKPGTTITAPIYASVAKK